MGAGPYIAPVSCTIPMKVLHTSFRSFRFFSLLLDFSCVGESVFPPPSSPDPPQLSLVHACPQTCKPSPLKCRCRPAGAAPPSERSRRHNRTAAPTVHPQSLFGGLGMRCPPPVTTITQRRLCDDGLRVRPCLKRCGLIFSLLCFRARNPLKEACFHV